MSASVAANVRYPARTVAHGSVGGRVVELWTAGWRQADIARDIGITRGSVSQFVRRARQNGVAGPAVSPSVATRHAIIAGWLAGLSQREIKDQVGVAQSTVSSAIYRARKRGIEGPSPLPPLDRREEYRLYRRKGYARPEALAAMGLA